MRNTVLVPLDIARMTLTFDITDIADIIQFSLDILLFQTQLFDYGAL